MSTKREYIRHGRGKSFEIECPRGFSGIEAIVCWCDAGDGWHHEAFESFLDARGRLDDLMRGDEATMCFVERTVAMNTADAIDPDTPSGDGRHRGGRVDSLPPQGRRVDATPGPIPGALKI